MNKCNWRIKSAAPISATNATTDAIDEPFPSKGLNVVCYSIDLSRNKI